ncbi:transposase, partial [Lactobacillus helveticus MTCC 5463]
LNGLIFHTDRGWQYQHKATNTELAIRGIEQSMSRKGCSPDDGLMEASLAFLNEKCSMVRRINMTRLTN